MPIAVLAVLTVVLIAGRVALNIVDSNVIDVGYSGVIGADRIGDRKPLYGNFPYDDQSGDTYGPVAYYAYVPFEQALPWSGTWDDLPAAHAASIFFDLATMGPCSCWVAASAAGVGGRSSASCSASPGPPAPTPPTPWSRTPMTPWSRLPGATLLCLTAPPARDHAGPDIDDQVRPACPRAPLRHLRSHRDGRRRGEPSPNGSFADTPR